MNAPARIRYPRKADLTRLIAAARAAGVDVRGIKVSPDGSIELVEQPAVSGGALDEFAELERQGLL